MRVLIVENGFSDLKKSRFPLGSYFELMGVQTYYACPEPKEKSVFGIPMNRNSFSPLKLLQGYSFLSSLEVKLSIDTVLSFRFIPNVLNYLASFKNGQVKRVAVITGLGYAFISTNNSISGIIQRTLIKFFYKIASKRIQIVAQNSNDLNDIGISNGKVILGSGVRSIESISRNNFHADSIKLLYVGRLLRSKGILDAIDIFDQLKKRISNTSLIIAGSIDEENPDSIDKIKLDQIRKMQGVKYLGFVKDMDSVYVQCNVLLFPSLYREGIPRVIIESLSHGLTIITKDMPGCKETIHNNGFLISSEKSIDEVVNYLINLNYNRIINNSLNSKMLFNNFFCDKIIFPQYLQLLK